MNCKLLPNAVDKSYADECESTLLEEVRRIQSEFFSVGRTREESRSGSVTTRQSPDGGPVRKDVLPCMSERTNAILRGLKLLLQHHGADQFLIDSFSNQFRSFFGVYSVESHWMESMKYFLCQPLAEYLKNDPPSPPDRVIVWTGPVRRWMRNRLHVYCRRNTHLWFSWLQGKRCALPVSDSVVEATYEKHFTQLSRTDSGSDATIDAIFDDNTFLTVLDRVREAVKKNFSHSTEVFPSQNACFEGSRSQGGQAQRLRAVAGMDDFRALGFDNLSSYADLYDDVIEVREPAGRQDWESLAVDSVDTLAFYTYMKENTRHMPSVNAAISSLPFSLKMYLDFERRSMASCTIQAVLEPMKVRVISKGSAVPYYSMSPLQKVLHDAIRQISCFRLVGQSFCPTMLMDLMRGSTSEDYWYSIDYSAATDNLSWKYSGRILKYILSDLSQYDQNLAYNVLGPHKLHYPGNGGKVFRGVQVNGQLMGSILSFPILCLANLGVYLYTMTLQQWDLTDEERLSRVLVNGDDMLYRAPDYLWDYHVAIAEAVGLKMSVGKAYLHKRYANVNSVSCDYPFGGTPWRIDFLNTGLFFGQHKVQNRVELAGAHMSDDSGSCIANINTVLSGSLPGRQSSLLSLFLVQRREEIGREAGALLEVHLGGEKTHRPFTRNLFIAKSLGGFGVDLPLGFKTKITRNQKRVAAMRMFDQRPVSRASVPEGDVRLDCPERSFPWSMGSTLDEIPVFHVSLDHLRAMKDLGKPISFADRHEIYCEYVPIRASLVDVREVSPWVDDSF
jgi:hypothetical protein